MTAVKLTPVTLGLDGDIFEVKLTSTELRELRKTFKSITSDPDKAVQKRHGNANRVREWAQEQGIALGLRGRISAEVWTQYEEAMKPAKASKAKSVKAKELVSA